MKTILAIETSCDETGIAIIQGSGKTKPVINVLADVIASQIAIHKEYGGVVPHLAAREHEKNLPIVLRKALKKSGITPEDVDVIAVTKGPGLSPALWRGINFAKELAQKWHKPLVGVDHMEGHLSANFIHEISGETKSKLQITNQIPNTPPSLKLRRASKYQIPVFPILCLTVSGGHTQLVLVRNWAQFELLGETVDDAAGEAFDKVARMLELPYPGGPAIARLAAQWKSQFPKLPPSLKLRRASNFQINPNASNPKPLIDLPRPMMHTKDYNFSFSGLKTAVLYKLRDIKNVTSEIKQDIATSFQQAVIDVLVKKTIRAAKEYNVKTIMLAGGVAANQELRNQLGQAIEQNLPNPKSPVGDLGSPLRDTIYKIPNTRLCTDNGAMIGAAAYIRLATQTRPPKPWRRRKLRAKAGLAQKDVNIRPIEAEPARLITDP